MPRPAGNCLAIKLLCLQGDLEFVARGAQQDCGAFVLFYFVKSLLVPCSSEQSGSCSETLLTHCLTPTLMPKLRCSSFLPASLPLQAHSCRGGLGFAGWGSEPPALDRTHFYILLAGNNQLYLKRMWIQSAIKSSQQPAKAVLGAIFLPAVRPMLGYLGLCWKDIVGR